MTLPRAQLNVWCLQILSRLFEFRHIRLINRERFHNLFQNFTDSATCNTGKLKCFPDINAHDVDTIETDRDILHNVSKRGGELLVLHETSRVGFLANAGSVHLEKDCFTSGSRPQTKDL